MREIICSVAIILVALLILSLLLMYRVFRLRCNLNYYTWTPSRTKWRNQWQYWVLAAVYRCCWSTATYRYGRNFGYFVPLWALVTGKHSNVPKFCYQPLYSCVIRHFRMRTRIASALQVVANDLMRSNVREWTHILLVNTPCLYLHSFCANGVSIVLTTRVSLALMSRVLLGECVQGCRHAFDFIFVT
jgi:hypothetical protein